MIVKRATSIRFAAMLQNKLHVFCCPFFRTFRARQDKDPAPTDTDFYKNMNTSLLVCSFTAECSRFVQYGFTTLIIRDQSEYSKKILSALWGSVWSKNKRGRPPPPGPLPYIRHCSVLCMICTCNAIHCTCTAYKTLKIRKK